MLGRIPWRYDFEEHGGEGGESDAFVVRDAGGMRLFIIDFKTFGWGTAGEGICEPTEVVAKRIVEAVNRVEPKPKVEEVKDPEHEFTCPQCGGHKYKCIANDPCNPRAGQIVFCNTDPTKCRWSNR
jgi:hypothetical protein